MARDVTAYLQDVLEACTASEDVMSSVSLEEYRTKGEALGRVGALDESLFRSISNSRAIVDFRNILAHDYGAVDDDAVFGLVYSDLILLKAEVGDLLHDFHDSN